MILMSTDKVYLEDGYNDVFLSIQGYKLSRYGRQTRELVENGGSGFAEVLQYPSASSNRTHEQEDNGESAKRPRFESQQRGVAVGYTTPTSQHPAPQQVAVSLM